MTEQIRILRVLEYTGPRDEVERQVKLSKHGEYIFGAVTLRAVTVHSIPEILESPTS
jgi:hypothetical protein